MERSHASPTTKYSSKQKSKEAGEGKTTKKTTKKKTKTSFNIDALVSEVFDQLNALFSLTSDLQLPEEKARELIKEIVDQIASSYSSRPTGEMIVKKAKKYLNILNEYVASRILSELENLTPTQLEYVITRGGRAVIPEASRLYNLAVKTGREDLVETLRYVWNKQGPRGMIECPSCGFNAIGPDRSCVVCGKLAPEDYIKRRLNFAEKFEVFLKNASIAELNEVLNYGYVLLGERGIYNPRSQRARLENPVVYIVYLNRVEQSRVIEEVNSRELPI